VQGWHGMWSVGAASCLWSGGPRARGGDGEGGDGVHPPCRPIPAPRAASPTP
jgi:hypothetical protein